MSQDPTTAYLFMRAPVEKLLPAFTEDKITFLDETRRGFFLLEFTDTFFHTTKEERKIMYDTVKNYIDERKNSAHVPNSPYDTKMASFYEVEGMLMGFQGINFFFL